MTVPMSRNSEVLVGEIRSNPLISYPILSMYGIFTYMGWWIFMGNVGKYTIHGCYGYNMIFMVALLALFGPMPCDLFLSSNI